jgi:hypothetical protein
MNCISRTLLGPCCWSLFCLVLGGCVRNQYELVLKPAGTNLERELTCSRGKARPGRAPATGSPSCPSEIHPAAGLLKPRRTPGRQLLARSRHAVVSRKGIQHYPFSYQRIRLTIETILAWADTHRDRIGRWGIPRPRPRAQPTIMVKPRPSGMAKAACQADKME